VALLEQYYALVKPLPYKSGASVGAYEDFLYSPGPLLPRSWVDVFPRWSLIVVAGQTLWQWIGILLVLVVVVTCTSAVYAIGRRWDQNFAGVSALLQFGKPATSLFLILAMPIVSIVADSAINFTGLPRVGLEFIIVATTYGSAAWLAALIILRIGEGVINSRRLGSVSLNSQLIRTISLLVAAVVVIYIAVVAAEAFGVPIAPLIAGLGIGGLAIALAVRPTLENIIGGFILFADKPVKVGDFCSFGDKRGTVEKIGIRSTQLRAIDRTLISIPNAQFANMELVNWAECDEMLINEVISLRYETTADQLRYFLAKLREMLHAHPRINSETVRVRFSGYGESSLNVTVRVYALTREWNDYHAIREDIFLRVYDLVNEAGTGFAFPSSTVYLSKDEGLDSEIALSAVDEVNAWRRDGQLPFPNFSSGQLEKIGRSLDYPPQGSTDSSSPKGVENEAAEPLSANTESDLYPENNRPKN
jgi:MscS family membrane protein